MLQKKQQVCEKAKKMAATAHLNVLIYLSIFSKTFSQVEFHQRSHRDTRNYGGYLMVKSRYMQMKPKVLAAIEEKHAQCLALEYFHEQFHAITNDGTNSTLLCSTDEFEENFRSDLKNVFDSNFQESSEYSFYKSFIYSLFECATIDQKIESVEFLTKRISTEEMKILNEDEMLRWIIRWSPLHYAIAIQNSHLVKLLEIYYDPEKEIKHVGPIGTDDPLELAIVTRNLEAFEILAKKVTDINKVNLYGDRYIDIAASLGHYKFVGFILRKSGFKSIEAVLKAGTYNRPLIIAGQEGHISVVYTIWEFLFSLDNRMWALFKDSEYGKSFDFDSKVSEFIQNRTELVERYIGKRNE